MACILGYLYFIHFNLLVSEEAVPLGPRMYIVFWVLGRGSSQKLPNWNPVLVLLPGPSRRVTAVTIFALSLKKSMALIH